MSISNLTRAGAATLAMATALSPATAVAGGDDIVLRRDGSKAVPFQKTVEPAGTDLRGAGGFDWGDAGVGAGAAALAAALAAAGAVSLRGARQRQGRGT